VTLRRVDGTGSPTSSGCGRATAQLTASADSDPNPGTTGHQAPSMQSTR
jgi:hypothetical protein